MRVLAEMASRLVMWYIPAYEKDTKISSSLLLAFVFPVVVVAGWYLSWYVVHFVQAVQTAGSIKHNTNKGQEQ